MPVARCCGEPGDGPAPGGVLSEVALLYANAGRCQPRPTARAMTPGPLSLIAGGVGDPGASDAGTVY